MWVIGLAVFLKSYFFPDSTLISNVYERELSVRNNLPGKNPSGHAMYMFTNFPQHRAGQTS